MDPESQGRETAEKAGGIGMGLMVPATFVVAWILALTGTQAPGAVAELGLDWEIPDVPRP